MRVDLCVTFGLGVVGGLIGGYFLGKKRTQEEANERADQEIKEMKKYYERKLEKSGCSCGGDCKCKTGMGDDGSNRNGGSEGSGTHRTDTKDTGRDGAYGTHKDVSEKENRDEGSRDHVAYNKCYKPGTVKPDVSAKPADEDIELEPGCDPTADYDDEDEEDELERETDEIERADQEYRRNANRKPRIISVDSLGDLPPTVQNQLMYYYPESDSMYDEDDNRIEDYERFVGECLNQYGFSDEDNDEKIIFVRNFDLDVVYEIQKVPGLDPVDQALEEMGDM